MVQMKLKAMLRSWSALASRVGYYKDIQAPVEYTYIMLGNEVGWHISDKLIGVMDVENEIRELSLSSGEGIDIFLIWMISTPLTYFGLFIAEGIANSTADWTERDSFQ